MNSSYYGREPRINKEVKYYRQEDINPSKFEE